MTASGDTLASTDGFQPVISAMLRTRRCARFADTARPEAEDRWSPSEAVRYQGMQRTPRASRRRWRGIAGSPLHVPAHRGTSVPDDVGVVADRHRRCQLRSSLRHGAHVSSHRRMRRSPRATTRRHEMASSDAFLQRQWHHGNSWPSCRCRLRRPLRLPVIFRTMGHSHAVPIEPER